MIESAKEKIGLPDDKVHVNIDRYGNSSAGSVGLCLDELWRAVIKSGDNVVLVAFGAGMTVSSVWRLERPCAVHARGVMSSDTPYVLCPVSA